MILILTKTEIKTHTVNGTRIAEVISADLLIETEELGLDLIGAVYFQDFDKMILHLKNIAPSFFDLKNGVAGDILQKFSNYRIRLAVVGDFSKYESRSTRDFINESNRLGQINFVTSINEALEKLSVKF